MVLLAGTGKVRRVNVMVLRPVLAMLREAGGGTEESIQEDIHP